MDESTAMFLYIYMQVLRTVTAVAIKTDDVLLLIALQAVTDRVSQPSQPGERPSFSVHELSIAQGHD
jgi:hypothetical protein